jgi:hypothetical protein
MRVGRPSLVGIVAVAAPADPSPDLPSLTGITALVALAGPSLEPPSLDPPSIAGTITRLVVTCAPPRPDYLVIVHPGLQCVPTAPPL